MPAPAFGLCRPAAAPEMRLFALPYAGAGASAYRRWLTDLAHPEWLDFVALQLPGRETRATEPVPTAIEPLLDDLEAALGESDDLPFALFGYSFGALLAYELSLRLAARGRAPELVILAARGPSPRGPASLGAGPSKEAVMDKIRRLGGTPAVLMEDALFGEHFLPVITADLTVADGHRRAVPQILPFPILAIAGAGDPESPVARVAAWEYLAGNGFELRQVEGGHFFLHTAHAAVIGMVGEALARARPSAAAAEPARAAAGLAG